MRPPALLRPCDFERHGPSCPYQCSYDVDKRGWVLDQGQRRTLDLQARPHRVQAVSHRLFLMPHNVSRDTLGHPSVLHERDQGLPDRVEHLGTDSEPHGLLQPPEPLPQDVAAMVVLVVGLGRDQVVRDYQGPRAASRSTSKHVTA
jgi:hypothetical protein